MHQLPLVPGGVTLPITKAPIKIGSAAAKHGTDRKAAGQMPYNVGATICSD